MTSIVQSVQDIVGAVAPELTVVLVFFMSLALWKHLGQRNKGGKQWKTPTAQSPVKKVNAERAGHSEQPVLDEKALQAVRSAEAQMLKLLEQREFTRALNFFRTFERDGRDRYFSEELLSAFIQSSIRVGKVDVVERLLRSMKRRGTEPSRDFWRTTLKMLSSRKHFDACLSIYSTFGRTLPSDKIVFSCLINGALEHGAPERAAAMIQQYCEVDLEPKDHVLLFRTYVALNDVEAAEKAFRKLGEKMTALMLNLLLLTCVQSQQPERAFEHLQEAHVLQNRRENKDNIDAIVDVVSYNTVIKGFAQAHMLPRCFDLLHEMRSHNLEPDDVTFGTLLDMCIADNDMTAANQVVDLLVRGDKPVDTVMCTLFIKAFVRAQKLPKALELYEEMKQRNSQSRGPRPDIVTYSVLIKAFVDSHDLERALLLVEDMTAAGHTPDDIILTHLLEGCRYVGNHALGKRLFQDMLQAGVKPSDFTLITMVKLHGRCGAHEEAYQLVANWEKQHGSKPSVIHHTCLMSGCLRTKNYDQAWQAYKLMLETNIQPDETTMATLIPGMLAAQQWDRVIELAKFALKPPTRIPVAPETLNSALSQMRAASGQALQAMQLQTLMQEASIRVAPRNAKRIQ
jgi:pentatricopeptide repeat protein